MMLLLECIIVAIFSSIIGTIIYKFSVNKKNNMLLIVAFFITGFAIHLVLELTGFNKMICDKTCMKTLDLLNK